MLDHETLMLKLRVGAFEDITDIELKYLIEYIQNLEAISVRYDNVMDSMSIDYEDMFPSEEDDH